MNEQTKTLSYPYRDQRLQRLTIEAKMVDRDRTGYPCSWIVVEFRLEREHYAVTFEWEPLFRNYYDQVTSDTLLEANLNLAKLLVLNGGYRTCSVVPYTAYKTILVRSADKEDEKGDFTYHIEGNEITWINPSIDDLPVMESRLARRVILHEMYHRTDITLNEMRMIAHFPLEIIEREMNSLNASNLVAHDLVGGVSHLTTTGREYYEEHPWKGSGIAFIIAACHADSPDEEDAHQVILKCYRETLTDAGYTAIFQENEEPHKNIYADIWDYLSTCDFVVADITYDRFNCYVEVGYALAKNRHIIGFAQEEYFSKKKGEAEGRGRTFQKIPWDLFPIRFQDYSKGNPAGLRKLLEERVGVVKSRRSGA
jgi:hypothetical protein